MKPNDPTPRSPLFRTQAELDAEWQIEPPEPPPLNRLQRTQAELDADEGHTDGR